MITEGNSQERIVRIALLATAIFLRRGKEETSTGEADGLEYGNDRTARRIAGHRTRDGEKDSRVRREERTLPESRRPSVDSTDLQGQARKAAAFRQSRPAKCSREERICRTSVADCS
jgi:hypothetical protein